MGSYQRWDWKKSSYSTGQNNCVETACIGRGVSVRDTKDRAIPAISVSPEAWGAFIGRVR